MKTRRLFCCFILATVASFASDAKPDTDADEDAGDIERSDCKIIKVYSAQQGAAKFRAYAVTWKNQEIVVLDYSACSSHKEGETVPVYAFRRKSTNGDILRFSLDGIRRIPP